MPHPFAHISPEMLYIHWPFCASKCTYCDFVAMQNHDAFALAYHKALCNEIRAFAQNPHVMGHPIRTIFIGGGTPSLYPLPLLKELFALLRASFNLLHVEEVSMEVNPGGQTEHHFQAWKDAGINRLSVGVQVLDEKILEKLRRPQKTADVLTFFSEAPKYIKNLSADVIIGLPGVTEEIWHKTIMTAMGWDITHCSMYFLTVHENTPLYHGVKAGDIALPRDEQAIAQYEWAVKTLEEHGFSQYEISNFARPGFQSQHNKGYWERHSYKGFGIGAASFDGNFRTCNDKNLSRYIAAWGDDERQGEVRYSYYEKLTPEQKQMEHLMLGLRQVDGVDLHSVVYLSNAQERASFFSTHERLVTQGYLEPSDSVVQLTRKGRLFENEVVVQLSNSLQAVTSDKRSVND